MIKKCAKYARDVILGALPERTQLALQERLKDYDALEATERSGLAEGVMGLALMASAFAGNFAGAVLGTYMFAEGILFRNLEASEHYHEEYVGKYVMFSAPREVNGSLPIALVSALIVEPIYDAVRVKKDGKLQ